MRNSIINAFIFAAGAAIGSAVTWKFVKTKYERIANEEIKSVKEVYSRKYEPIDDDTLASTIEEVNRYCDEIEKCGYSVSATTNRERRGKPVTNDGPYIISPEEFDELDGYEAVTLTYYYGDGVLTNMWDSPLDEGEIEETVGKDFAEHFGEYEDDSVFVRNDDLKADYEILRDMRSYQDVVSGDDPQQEDE